MSNELRPLKKSELMTILNKLPNDVHIYLADGLGGYIYPVTSISINDEPGQVTLGFNNGWDELVVDDFTI